jgi:phosphohistidine phosphatase SixA
MPLLYRTADIMCTPSLNEAFGLVFIEAMSMGIPSIGAKSGGITEIIKNKKTGFLINPRDSNELAKIITSLLKDDSLRNKIGLAGQKCVKQKFSYKNMLCELEKLYNSIPQKIYLIRHPETIKNKNCILTGWENSNYSKDGKKQFNKILDFFKGHQERIFSSDLPRCLNLAESISKKNDSLLIPTAFLREKNLKETRPYENFESNKEFIKRIKNFLRNYSLNGSIIISHSGVISNICKNAFKTEKELTNFPRDTIFLIETNKKEKKLIKIKL